MDQSRPDQRLPAELGSSVCYAEIPPESAVAHMDPAAVEKMMRDRMASIGAEHFLVPGRHWRMHRTPTIDYVVLLSGKLTLMLDEGEVEIGPGDVVVQRGTAHSWINRGEEPARTLSITINARPAV